MRALHSTHRQLCYVSTADTLWQCMVRQTARRGGRGSARHREVTSPCAREKTSERANERERVREKGRKSEREKRNERKRKRERERT
eukprot:1194656-Rhodomonas_salina.3